MQWQRIPPVHPVQIGKYRIEKVLGRGGCGTVYQGFDAVLKRLVAIKVPHPYMVSKPEDVELYLEEGQVLASLDHPHIVPVFEADRTTDGLCYVVSKFIEGTNLGVRIKQSPLSHRDTAEIIAVIAEALHHAHLRKVVHRDIKPANILLDCTGKPYVADFGLALTDEQFGKTGHGAGTPVYMSPEQARGEGHLVDGRSDIFSLGVVFYELLTGTRPFQGTDKYEVIERIKTLEVRPPRQLLDSIPKELERICLKALSKRATERYTTALDMADDLRHFRSGVPVKRAVEETPTGDSNTVPVATIPPASVEPDSGKPIKIVPKGLRSFDAQDADFFLELLPGPRDRDGLPESIRFWKYRIKETDPDKTFRIGLIYGPSGCGKSSLVKAGLLPRLTGHVISIYVEATAEDTETRLLQRLRKECPRLPQDLGLTDSIATLRRGQGLLPGKKVLIVLDQFEQWLHAKRSYENTELVEALRHCDGERAQCIVMVRDDFWMAVTRFMQELEIRLIEGDNSAAVDLFDLRHTRKVLAAFGRAFGVLPEDLTEPTTEQTAFLEQAASGLAEEGKVICVRLALFAEMMKAKPWTSAALKAVGGTEGIGVTFLEETFSASVAPPEHRYHQKAGRAVLKVLLPESGTDIKGHMRSYTELLAASGYLDRPKDFRDLIGILDGEIRLITPTDPKGKEEANESASEARTGERNYQLTHDYLVPSLREWLTRKQRETRKGRAELAMANALQYAKRKMRELPYIHPIPPLPRKLFIIYPPELGLYDYIRIRMAAKRNYWSEPERKVLDRVGRYWGISLGFLAVLSVLAIWFDFHLFENHQDATRAEWLVGLLVKADITVVPYIVNDLEDFHKWADPLIKAQFDQAKEGSRQRLNMALALLPVDATQVEYLYKRLLDATPNEFPVLRDALTPHKDELVEKLWTVVEQPAQGHEQQRLRAACALAAYDPESQQWAEVQNRIADDLVAVPAVYLAIWMDALRAVRGKLRSPLSAIFQDAKRTDMERSLATEILADYAADQPDVLAGLLMDADEKQFAVLYPRLKEHGERGTTRLLAEIDKPLQPLGKDGKERLAKRQANAAAALLKMSIPKKVWSLLKHSPDPR